jgi:hypothetical protein
MTGDRLSVFGLQSSVFLHAPNPQSQILNPAFQLPALNFQRQLPLAA